MRNVMFHNADKGRTARTILAGCYKFGAATLLREGGATMTSVIEVYETKKDKVQCIPKR